MLEPTEVAACTNRCAATGRVLQPGEEIISALVRDGLKLRRVDFSREAWPVREANLIAWWRTVVPGQPSAAPSRLKPTTLIEVMEQLLGAGDQQDLAYMLALILLRRRILRWEGEIAPPGEGIRVVLRHVKTGRIYEVPVVPPKGQRRAAMEQVLRSLLGLQGEPPGKGSTRGDAEANPSLPTSLAHESS